MPDFLRKYVWHNFGLKLLSLALAIMLWFVVARDPQAEVALSVPIEFHRVPDNLEISSETIPQAQVRVRGPVRMVRSLGPSDVHAEIDLAGAKPGERTFDLTSQQVRARQDLEIVQIVPSQLRISFDVRKTRRVEVRPRVIGTFASGLRIARVLAEPAQITITGPEHRVNGVDAAITDPVDATGTVTRQTFSTHAYVSDPLVQVVRPEPIRVTVIMEKTAVGAGGR